MYCLVHLYSDSMKELVAPLPVYPLEIKARPKMLRHLPKVTKSLSELRSELRYFISRAPGARGQQTFSAKDQTAKYFWPNEKYGLCHKYSTVTVVQKLPQKTRTVRHSRVPTKLYLWTLKVEFHTIFTCDEISFLFDFFPAIQKSKNHS